MPERGRRLDLWSFAGWCLGSDLRVLHVIWKLALVVVNHGVVVD